MIGSSGPSLIQTHFAAAGIRLSHEMIDKNQGGMQTTATVRIYKLMVTFLNYNCYNIYFPLNISYNTCHNNMNILIDL